MRPTDPKKINKMGLQTYVDSFWGLKEVTSSKSNKIILIVYGRIWLVVGSLPCFERFFSGYSGFPLSSKTNVYFLNFQFHLEHTDAFQRVLKNF